MEQRRKGSFRMREFRLLFAGLFCGLLLLEAAILVISLRERHIRNQAIADQALLLQAREAIDAELVNFLQLSELALKAATTGDLGHAKAHEELAGKLLRNDTSGPKQHALAATDAASRLQRLQNSDAVFRRDDVARLNEALADASSLLQADRKTLHAARGLFPDPDGGYTVRGENDSSALSMLLADDNSDKKRRSIRQGLADFLAALDVRIYASVEESTSSMQLYSQLLSYFIGVLLVSTIASGILLYRNISEPLQSFRIHSRKINDDLARTLAQLDAVTAERDALLKGTGTVAPLDVVDEVDKELRLP